MTLAFFPKTLWLGIILLVYTGFAYAETPDPNFALVSDSVKSICQKAAKTVIPPHDQPDASYNNLIKCDADALYYGFNQPVDFLKARQCAYTTKNYSVLTMLYANGKGVERNWDLAIRFACQAGFAPDEIEGRVMHLVQLRDEHWQGSNFDICDDITSGYMMGVCASQQEQLAQAQRQRKLASLMVAWNETDKTAFQPLQRAANHFFSVRSAHEVDLSGTGRAAFAIEEQAVLQDDFLSSLENLSQGRFPAYTASQVAQVDQQLNKVYQQIERNHDFSMGTVDRAGVKTTQLSWLQYRDAWVAFGKNKYPQVNEENWKTWLAEKRIKMLQDLAESS